MKAPLFTDDMATLPIDDDLLAFHRYTSGGMTEAECEDFEGRLAVNPAFFDRMAPMIKLWHSDPTVLEKSIARAAIERLRRAREARRNFRVGGLLAAAGLVLAITRMQLETKPVERNGPKQPSKAAAASTNGGKAVGQQPVAKTGTVAVAKPGSRTAVRGSKTAPFAPLRATPSSLTATPSTLTATPSTLTATSPVESDSERAETARVLAALPALGYQTAQPQVDPSFTVNARPMTHLAFVPPDTIGNGKDRNPLVVPGNKVAASRPWFWPLLPWMWGH